MNKYKILVVEDDEHIQGMLKTVLEANSFQVIIAKNCRDAFTFFYSYMPDFIILDLGLPDRDGNELIREVRKQYWTPILILSARSNESDKIQSLDLGANDYLTKPFSPGELMARIRTILRYTHQKLPGEIFTLGELSINYDTRKVRLNGEEIKLTQTEYNILTYLSEHVGKVMTYASIIKHIWGYADEGSIKKLQVNMANIRKKFKEKPGEATYITNDIGVGYRLDAPENSIL